MLFHCRLYTKGNTHTEEVLEVCDVHLKATG